jgi:hypothetical protein
MYSERSCYPRHAMAMRHFRVSFGLFPLSRLDFPFPFDSIPLYQILYPIYPHDDLLLLSLLLLLLLYADELLSYELLKIGADSRNCYKQRVVLHTVSLRSASTQISETSYDGYFTAGSGRRSRYACGSTANGTRSPTSATAPKPALA